MCVVIVICAMITGWCYMEADVVNGRHLSYLNQSGIGILRGMLLHTDLQNREHQCHNRDHGESLPVPLLMTQLNLCNPRTNITISFLFKHYIIQNDLNISS